MAHPFYNWSQTAGNNATADSTVNWQEGQAPSSVNDSARAMMASTAAYRDDIAGAIVTAGTSTAYTVSSYQVFDTLAHLSGQVIAFTPHTTNGATVTLNVDGLGAKPLRSAPNVELLAGTIIQGTPYTVIYNNTDGAFYLEGFFGNPYSVPLGAGLDYWLPTAPNSSFVFPFGQAISRTTYATLFSAVGTTYGVGDGTTTFNLPDKRGRSSACLDNMGGSAAGRITTTVTTNTTLGGVGGAEASTLSTSNLPPYTPTGSVGPPIVNSLGSNQAISAANGSLTTLAGSGSVNVYPANQMGLVTSGAFTGTPQGGTSTAFTNLQPTILCNYIMRII